MNKKIRSLLMVAMGVFILLYPNTSQSKPERDPVITTSKPSKPKKKPKKIGACSENYMSMYKGLWVEVPHKVKGLKVEADEDEGLINLNLETLMLQYCKRNHIRVTRK